ncbi:Uncharacterised protein [uncultured archaeon]|nr:Uncharacterised protein [uncultured archaeon]
MDDEFEIIRLKALELFEQRKISMPNHAARRMAERNILPSEIKLVLLHGSKYKEEIDGSGDMRYTMRGWDYQSKDIRITFIIKEALIIITVIREEE